jgi:hypothetical protein
MILENEQKIVLNKPFMIYLAFILWVFTTDLVYFLEFLFKHKNSYGVVLSSIICVTLFLQLRKKIIIEKLEINFIDILGFLLIIFIAFIKIPFPDNNYDLLNYHLFLQQPSFITDKASIFFPSGFLSYNYPLGDRMFYLFRYLLGFRLGVLPNLFALILINLQITSLLKKYFSSLELNNLLISGFSILAICSEYIFLNLSVYLIDIIYIPLLLELLQIILFNENENSASIYYFAILAGLSISFKITNIVFFVPILLIYTVRFRQKINFKNLFFAVIFFILPISVYALYSYISTGNPIFPFMNHYFNSQYTVNVNFKDLRWGPKTIFEYLTWPYQMLKNPQKISELSVYTGKITIGILFLLISIPSLVKHKDLKNTRNISLLIVYLLSFLLWEITTGYVRYAIFLEIISGIYITVLSVNTISKNNSILKFISYAFIFLLLFQSYNSLKVIIYENKDWSWRPSALTQREAYFDNFKLMLNDRRNTDEPIIHDIEVWVIINNNVGYATLLKSNIPIININEARFSERSKSMAMELLDHYKGKNLFSISRTDEFDQSYSYLINNGFRVKRIKEVDCSCMHVGQKLYLYEISKLADEKTEESLGENIILNDSFESLDTDDTKADKTLVNWSLPVNNDQIREEGKAADGKVYVGASIDSSLFEEVKLKPGTLYKLSFYSKSRNDIDTLTRFQVFWKGRESLISSSIKLINSNVNWDKYSMYLMSPENADSAIIYLNSNDKYYIYFDKISLCEIK